LHKVPKSYTFWEIGAAFRQFVPLFFILYKMNSYYCHWCKCLTLFSERWILIKKKSPYCRFINKFMNQRYIWKLIFVFFSQYSWIIKNILCLKSNMVTLTIKRILPKHDVIQYTVCPGSSDPSEKIFLYICIRKLSFTVF